MRMIIRATPARREFVEYLAKRLPTAEVVYDRNAADETMPNGRKAIRHFLYCLGLVKNEPAVFFEDDLLLTQNFESKLLAVIDQHPARVCQFFSMRKDDLTKGSRLSRHFSFTVCFYLPPGYAAAILAYAPTWPKLKVAVGWQDVLVNDFLAARREAHWITVPSLVQHRVAKSLLGPRSSKRQSFTFMEGDNE